MRRPSRRRSRGVVRDDRATPGRALWTVPEQQSIARDLREWALELPAVRVEHPRWYLERYSNSRPDPVGVFPLNPSPDDSARAARMNRLAEVGTRAWRLYDPSLRRALRAMAEVHGLAVATAKRDALLSGLYEAWIECDNEQLLTLKKGREWRRPVELPMAAFWAWLVKRAIHYAEKALRAGLREDAKAVGLDTSGRVPGAGATRTQLSASQASPLDALIAAESAADRDARLVTLLNEATLRERELLRLLTDRHLTDDQTANLMGIAPSTVRVMKHRLRQRAAQL
jgi:DNA-binding CsgD family transcriptional regulator